MNRPEALLIGGRSGVGKSVVGWEVSARLRAAGVAHAIVEGGFMGQVALQATRLVSRRTAGR